MEPKQPMSWKLYRQELHVEELDEEFEVIDKDIDAFELKLMKALVRQRLEPLSSLLKLYLPPSEDE